MKNNTIAFIPARGGSKRFPRKNVALLNDKPLIAWTIESAIESGAFEKIVVSSDDLEILEAAEKYGRDKIVLHQRSEAFSGDTVTAPEVLGHLLRELAAQGEEYQRCCLLLPTCPFRSAEDIVKAQALLNAQVDSVISMKPSPVVADFIFQEGNDGVAHPLLEDTRVIQGKTRSQDYPDMYYPNGAIYLAWTETFLKENRFYSRNFKILPMPEFRSVDIDIEEDLIYAHAIYEHFLKTPQA
ncbi:acylneuraminate cytidylyltransferase family protein [Thiomicrorhabdus heinhorstiae]|uniref:Acylneuraminate cytidylyltransferase family protein n=1 Tax=Thiomicrorhabdus heinhorstiae TaxID=2748010 RepID=A0ABS0BXZ9_9GAMM|nr:acylneuraminate cytidylyltransferase family protein [Thiomicrorhabdus heinhorstiae]MBF6058668.1 acylneuraminate cytidylyltransferase family protein [Thiomicrorhabdus heinhorstiae]